MLCELEACDCERDRCEWERCEWERVAEMRGRDRCESLRDSECECDRCVRLPLCDRESECE